jgi:YrbI family 3-deoxy-D-manno-octulosonate 8-phosphate phosphatase
MGRLDPALWPRIELLALDCDGVLTDGRVAVDADGREVKRFSLRDGHGISLAREAGLIVAIITRSGSAAIEARGAKLGIEVITSRDKARSLRELCARHGVDPQHAAFVGDDVFDLPAMRLAGLGVTVGDAHGEVLSAADWVTEAPGGQGAVRELIDTLLARTAPSQRSSIASITDQRCYLIAEIGQNHQGELSLAKELLHSAKLCGVDAVKSQKRDIMELLTPEERARPYTSAHAFGPTYGEHREALELTPDEYAELFDYARALGIDFFASPWDVSSAKLLDQLGCPLFKIASASLTHGPLLDAVIATGKPVVLSTGMSTLDEIDVAVERLSETELYILQCTSAYPASFDSIHLRAMQSLRERYGRTTGLSGHHKGIAVDAAAIALGARIIERHFTLDRTWKGSDHAASLEPPGLAKLVRDVRAVEAALGDTDKQLLECELGSRNKLRGSVALVEEAAA